ncbi:hypothetical protein PFISCL1PPCAC_5959, partial [Pristionchus fissidentatus]
DCTLGSISSPIIRRKEYLQIVSSHSNNHNSSISLSSRFSHCHHYSHFFHRWKVWAQTLERVDSAQERLQLVEKDKTNETVRRPFQFD